MKSLYIVTAVILLGALGSPAMAQTRVRELGYEVSTSMIRLPADAAGELTVQRCATCQVLRLRANPDTRYLIGGESVTLAEMTRYLAANPTASLVVMQLKGTSDLTRVVVHATYRAQ